MKTKVSFLLSIIFLSVVAYGGLPSTLFPKEAQGQDAFHKILWAFEHGGVADPKSIKGIWEGFGAFDNPLPRSPGCDNFPPVELSNSLQKNIKNVFYFPKKIE